MIDFHVHEPSAGGGAWPYDPAEYARFAAGLGIELSVAFTFDGLLRPSAAANDSVARFAAAAPGRYAWLATVDPRDAGAAAEVERCLAAGAKGVKLHPWLQGFHAHGAFLDPVCETLAPRGLPLLLHDGTPPYSTPLQIAALARRHPRVPVVLGHGGMHDLWREAIAAVNGTPNVHVCLCATPGHAMRAVIDGCPSDRLLFGTDGGLAPTARQTYVEARVRQLDALGLADSVRDAMLSDNPRGLLER